MVSYLIFKSLNHFEFIFVYDVRVCSGFIGLHGTVQSYFCLLAVVNNVAINMCANICWSSWFYSFAYLPRSEIVGSCSNSIFNFLRNDYTVRHGGYTIL